MITVMNVLALAAAALAQQTDTTFAVRPGVRLEVENMSGEVRIVAWNRDAVRVRATHPSGGRVDVDETGAVVRVRTRAQHGMPTANIEVAVPRSMQVSVSGTFTNAHVEGTAAPVVINTVHGNVMVRGGTTVRAEAVQGNVTVEDASGAVEAKSVNHNVRVSGATGDVRAEAINGNVVLERIQSANVRGGTVNGRVSYAGAIRDGGRYSFTTHSGDVVVALPEGANVTVSLATITGNFTSELPIQVTETRPGRRVTVTLGTGSAQLELESFSGSVRLTRSAAR